LISHLDGTTYTIQNVGTGKFLHYAHSNPSSGINVNQYDGIDHITLKWSISNNGDGTFTFSPAANNALAMSVDAGFDEDGLNVLLHDKDELPAQLWTLEPVSPLDPAPTDAIADEVFEAWKTKYYYTDANGGHIRNEGFWGVAEMMEIVLDAYETSGKAKYINMFDEMYEGFLADEGTNWLWNDFNDDIMWITIACSRAYLFTGDQKYLYKAAYHFDQVYNRAWTDAYGGGLEWKEGLTTKNSCINGPAIVAACYLLQATDNQRYLTTAERIYEWQRRMLYDQNSGAVWDSYDGPGNINYWSSTYNQGTFLGAAVMLYNLTGDQMYYEDAVKIANYTRHNMYNNGVINWESGRDLEGFKGIFVRYARRYVVDFNKDNYIDWFQKNAQVAYNNRNSEGIISTLWGTRTKEDVDYNAFDASTAVSLMVNCPVETEVLKDAYNIIEAEDFNYLKGIVTEPCLEGTDYVGEILDGDYTGYNHVFFGNQSLTGAEFRVSNGSANDGTIEIRLDGPGGAVIGTATVAPTSDWTEYTTVTCDVENVNGFRNVYLVFKGDGDIARINHFKFLSEGTEGNLNGNFAIRNRNSGLIMEIADS
jgi:predicted alpha-1,6-mannanase (GH76 family)